MCVRPAVLVGVRGGGLGTCRFKGTAACEVGKGGGGGGGV